MNVLGFEMVNDEKVNRVIFGTTGREGKLYGGVGEDAAPEVILAEYDKLGGEIRKGTRKVKTGCFWDFENKKAFEKPEVIFTFRDVNGDEWEVPEGAEVPIEVQAAEMAKAKKVTKMKGMKGKK